MPIRRFRADRRCAVALMFALGAVPIIGLAGAAVDFGIWNQTNATMAVAANVAAMTAVKIAANAQLAGDPNAKTEGQQAAAQWFAAEVQSGGRVGTNGVNLQLVNVNMTMGVTVSAQVSYTGQVPSIFGGLFRVLHYPIGGQAIAAVTSAPYLNVEILIDNSSSMDIGATMGDMQLLNNMSACDVSNAFYDDSNGNPTVQQSLDPYNSYQYTGYGRTYDGTLTTPAIQTGLQPPPGKLVEQADTGIDPPCQGVLPKQSDGHIPLAGPPCAFACHWDKTYNNSLANDLYGMARKTLGTAHPITLRLDIVKNATNQVITTMQQDNLQINNLNVGLFTFNTALNQIYPSSGEAAGNWSAAQAAVGTPPTQPTMSENGILPVIAARTGNNKDTNFPEAMAALTSTYLTTPSGDGTDANHPRKVLFIITDGFLDDSISNARTAFDRGRPSIQTTVPTSRTR